MRVVFITLVILLSISLQGQTPVDEQIIINREREFKGEALYGFMNGGSELYLEYGFQTLNAIDIEYKGIGFSVEIYQMDTPENAFGIYSQHTFRCNPADHLFRYDCTSPAQYQLAAGNFYISIVSQIRSEGAQSSVYELADYYLKKVCTAQNLQAEELRIPDELLNEIKYEDKFSNLVKYASGPLALSNSLSPFMYLFDNIPSYKVWILARDGNPSVIVVRFKDKESLDLFYNRCKSGDNGITLKEISGDAHSLIVNFHPAS